MSKFEALRGLVLPPIEIIPPISLVWNVERKILRDVSLRATSLPSNHS